MTMIKYLLTPALFCCAVSLQAQTENVKHCGQTEATQELYSKHPGLQQRAESIQQNLLQQNYNHKTASASYVIPVVFHIMHEYGPENISDAQVIDEMRILNEDYQLRNADTTSIVPSFQNLKANLNIEFRLAKLDPNGNCTNGILHIATPYTNIGNDDVKYDQWDPSKYLNVWVVKTMMSGAAGYAYYPSTADGWPAIDGVVILSDYIGSIGTGSAYKSRALTHEIGHWLELQHTWGGTNQPGVACGDDGVTDTPDTQGWTTCNLSGSVCNPPTVENVQNYMEYAYCSRMFTLGQKQRMINALTSTVAHRNNIWSAANLLATGTDNASFTSTLTCKPIADLVGSYRSICQGSNITFSDVSYNAPVSSRQWTFAGGTPATSTASTQVVNYSSTGTFAVKLRVSNAQGADSIVKTSYITVQPQASSNPSSLYESFETISAVPNANWAVNSGADAYTWQIANVGATGNRSIMIENIQATSNDIDEIVSPSFNLSNTTNASLTFKVAFQQTNSTGNTDNLKVYSSKDCGAIWTQRYSKSGAALATNTNISSSPFTPSASDWRTETVTLPAFLTSGNTSIKFVFTAGKGNNVYIDDINISSTVSVEEFTSSNGLSFQVMPNPFSDHATIRINSATEESVSIELTDVMGKTVEVIPAGRLSIGDNTFSLDRGRLSGGLYFLNIGTGGQKITKKIIVQ